MHGRGMARSRHQVAGSGLTRAEWVLVWGSMALFVVLLMAGSGIVQPYESGVQIGYVFVDWHYVTNPSARAEIDG